jgi:putative addiction module killer protein
MKYELQKTNAFMDWPDDLKDRTTKIRVLSRLARVENGNFGDHKQLSEELYELKMTFGGGIRVYYAIQCGKIVVLLAGGNKSGQSKDIKHAEVLLKSMG